MSTKLETLVVTAGGAAPTSLKEALTGSGAEVSAIDLPATSTPEVLKQKLAAQLAESGTPDVLINTLHPRHPGRRPEEVDNAELQRGVDVNLTRTLLTCQEVGRAMIEAGKGVIVVVLAGAVDDPLSTVTDAAAVGLTRVLSVEWAPEQVRVVAVAPTGPGGPARDAAVAATIAFLASEDASYITGAVIPVSAAGRTR
ncbi:MAG: SDR family NAD(P)-dependent oxidoreductase [Micromonosporaceae bacterium]